MKIWLLSIAFVFCLTTFSFAGDKGYTSQKTNDNTTYTDKSTSKTYGSKTSDGYNTRSTTNGSITTHTYTNKNTGAVTGGSTWQNGNTTRSYGSSPPHPYNK